MPPDPRWETISYGPIWLPAVKGMKGGTIVPHKAVYRTESRIRYTALAPQRGTAIGRGLS